MSKKIFLSPERRPAPHGPYAVGGVYEHDVCNEIAVLEKTALERCGFEVEIASKNSSLEQRVAWANSTRVDYYQTIHSNGSKDGTATGAECCYYNHPASIKANQLVYDELVKLYPSKRGCKDFTKFYENNMTQMVSCYPEIGFHDNPADARFIIDNKKQIAEALAKGVCGYFGVTYLSEAVIAPEQYHRVQTGAWETEELAETYAAKLRKLTVDGEPVKVVVRFYEERFRAQTGAWTYESLANAFAKKLEQLQIDGKQIKTVIKYY